MKNFSIVCLFFFVLSSCSNHSNRQVAIDFVQNWMGKELKFPSDWTLQAYIGDSVIEYDFSNNQHAIVTYIDSVGCMSCKMNLPGWIDFIECLDSISGHFVPCIFILNPRSGQKTELVKFLKYVRFSYPVYIDEKDSFNLLNRFPAKKDFQTFLIDRNGKVLAVGNPVQIPTVKQLYLQIIQGKDIKKRNRIAIRTIITIDRLSVSLGNFDWQTEQKTTFTLKNMGNNPLVIEGISTSCGCISVSYSQEPVPPDKETRLEVTYKAERPEYFNKSITVYCNTESSPIVLSISGDAK